MFPSIPGSASYHRGEHFCWSKSAKTAAVFSTCFVTTTFLQNLVLNSDCITFFSRQNEAGFGALNVVLREKLVLAVVLVLESKAL